VLADAVVLISREQEAATGIPATEAPAVKLYCQIPPIVKLDNALNTLIKCEYVQNSASVRLRPSGLRRSEAR
jgi:hypothetical protein